METEYPLETSGSPYHQLKKLGPHHRGMARAEVAFGLKTGELAERFGLTTAAVTIIRSSDLYKAECARLERMADEAAVGAQIQSDLMILSKRAVEVVAEDLYQMNPSKHRSNMAIKTLDRAGFSSTKEPRTDNRRQTLNFVSLAPLPGEDPGEANERMQKVLEILNEDKKEEEE